MGCLLFGHNYVFEKEVKSRLYYVPKDTVPADEYEKFMNNNPVIIYNKYVCSKCGDVIYR